VKHTGIAAPCRKATAPASDINNRCSIPSLRACGSVPVNAVAISVYVGAEPERLSDAGGASAAYDRFPAERAHDR